MSHVLVLHKDEGGGGMGVSHAASYCIKMKGGNGG